MFKKIFIPLALLVAVLGTSYAITVPAWWMIGQSATDNGTASFTVPITTSQTLGVTGNATVGGTLGVTGKANVGTLESGAATFTSHITNPTAGTYNIRATNPLGKLLLSSPLNTIVAANAYWDGSAYVKASDTPSSVMLEFAGSTKALNLYTSDAGNSNPTQNGPYAVWHGGMSAFSAPTPNFYGNTSDGADNSYLQLCGGGAVSNSRGAKVLLYGNEAAAPGVLNLTPGAGASGTLDLCNRGGGVSLQIAYAGEVRIPAFAGGGTTGASLDNDGDIIRTPSDSRLKEDIQDITSGLDKVRAMRGVTFNWKDKASYGSRRDYGMIAQEVEEVIPEVVSQNPDGMKSLDYQKLVPVLVEAIKDQQRLIESQVAAIAALESRINALEGK